MSERDDAVDSANDCPEVDECSLLDAFFQNLENRHLTISKGLFKLWCDDFRPECPSQQGLEYCRSHGLGDKEQSYGMKSGRIYR